MSSVIITGSGGLIGSEAARHFHELGWHVIGVENDMRAEFFGAEASTAWMSERLQALPRFRHRAVDIRDVAGLEALFAETRDVELVIHTAAQPSHDWAARDPAVDFSVNANGTLNVLEAARRYCPEATFIFTSTNKVYGDTPNLLPLVEDQSRYKLADGHPYQHGIPVAMSIDQSTHSLFGVSKAAADLLVQEYGRYFGMNTVVFRGGCLTGPGHSGTELHGFLAYLMKCAATGRPYTVFGYKGKQVRDNIHSSDLVAAFEAVARSPRSAAVYNIGGGPAANCSMLEAIDTCESITGRRLSWTYDEQNRVGDHIWYISDVGEFKRDYPAWDLRYGIADTLTDIYETNRARWAQESASRP